MDEEVAPGREGGVEVRGWKMPKKEKRERARESRCFIAGGFVVLTDGGRGHRVERRNRGLEDPTGMAKVTLACRRSIKSADSGVV